MPDRSLCEIVLQDPAGTVRPNKLLVFREEDGTTPLGQALYATQSGGAPVVAPQVDALGTARYYVDLPQRAVCIASDDPAPFPVAFDPDPRDLILEGSSGHTLVDLAIDEDLAVGRFVTIAGAVTAAEIQAAVDADLGVILPEGTHAIDATITLRAGSSIRGMGPQATILSWTGATNGTVLRYASATFAPSGIAIRDLTIRTTVAGVTGIACVNGGFEQLSGLVFQGVARHLFFDRGFAPVIRDVLVGPWGPNAVGGSWFGSTDQADYLRHPTIAAFASYGNPNLADVGAVLTFSRVATGVVEGAHLYGVADPSKTKTGIAVMNDTQGLSILSPVIVGATVAVGIDEDPSYPAASFPTRVPTFTLLTAAALDQSRAFGVSHQRGAQTTISACAVTFSGQGVALGAASRRVAIVGSTFEQLANNAIVLGSGIAQVTIAQCRFFNIGASGGVSVTIPTGTNEDILIVGNDFAYAYTSGTARQIDDISTAGANRIYVNNSYDAGEEPNVLTPAGVTRISPTQIVLGTAGSSIAAPTFATNDPAGGYTASLSRSGSALNGVSITNTANAAGSDAAALLTVGGPAGGDAVLVLTVPATAAWSLGLDNSDGDAFVVSSSAALGGANKLKLATSGDVVLGSAAVAPNATAGWLWVVGAAGAPTGVPAAANAGRYPLVYDSTNNRLYVHNGSWRSVTLT